MKTMIHKKSKTISEKLINNADVKQFSGNEVMAMLAKLAVKPTVENVVTGIVTKTAKAPSKAPSRTAPAIEVVTVEGREYIQFNCPNGGKPFKFAGRKAYEIASYFDAVCDFAMVYAEENGLESPTK